MTLATLVARSPLPLAQLLVRCANAKSAEARHNYAYCLGEATLVLAAAARVSAVIGSASASPDTGLLAPVARPSAGHWLSLLRHSSKRLSEIGDPRSPFARDPVDLHAPRSSLVGVSEFARAAADEDIVSREVASGARRGTIYAFFEVMVAYRNRVIGHGGARPPRFFQRFGELLVNAVSEIIGDRALLGGLELGLAEPDATGSGLRAHRLVGLAGLPSAEPISLTSDSAGRVVLFAEGIALDLHPFLIHQAGDYGREQVGFLSGVSRARSGSESAGQWLDYSSGELIRGINLAGTAFDGLGSDPSLAAAGSEEAAADTQPTAGPSGAPLDRMIGDFEVEAELGRGAMGVVYLARQRSLQRSVAVKVLHPALVSDAVMMARFRREVASLGRLDHPNVVRILTDGRDGDRVFFAMEYVEGADLSVVARILSAWRSTLREFSGPHLIAAASSAARSRSGSLSAEGESPALPDVPALPAPSELPRIPAGAGYFERLARLFAGAAHGLQHLHGHGILHRDVKPANLALTREGDRIVVMDLGLAKVDEASRALTSSRTSFVGTLRYMAPEQLQSRLRPIDARADIYGLGASLYEVATCRPFFDGDTEQRLVAQVLEEDPMSPRRAEASIPRDLEAIILRATAKRPADRYASAAELGADLEAFADGAPIQARRPGLLRRVRYGAIRHRFALAVGVAVLALVAGVAGYVLREAAPVGPAGPNRELRYYREVVLTRTGGRGVGEVTPEVQKRRGMTHRLEIEDGRVLKVSVVNGRGTLVDDHRQLEYVHEGEALVRVVHRDRRNRVMEVWTPTRNGARWDIRDEHGYPRKPDDADSGDVFGELLEFDAAGLVRSRRSIGPNPFRDEPRMSSAGSWGTRYERAADSPLTLREVHLGPDGKDGVDRLGRASITYVYDGAGNRTEVSQVGADGAPTPDEWGCCRQVSGYDSSGNVTERTCFASDGKAVANKDGFARVVQAWDENGGLTQRSYFGVNGEPVSSRDGCATWRWAHDANGMATEEECLDRKGHLAVSVAGAARTKRRYEQGLVVDEAYFDIDGRPLSTKESGFARASHTYDAAGNRRRTAAFGTDGKPTIANTGCAAKEWDHDSGDRIVEARCYGLDGRLVLDTDWLAVYRYTYDERGNCVSHAFYGTDGKPTTHRNGFAQQVVRYDDMGQAVEFTHRTGSGAAAYDQAGVHRFTRGYDHSGQLVEQRSFGADGGLALDSGGASRTVWSFDVRGNKVEQAVFGVDDLPTRDPQGIHRMRMAYDDRSNLVLHEFLGPDNQPVRNIWGCAGNRRRYDSRSNLIEDLCLDERGLATSSVYGSAIWRAQFDAQGNIVEGSYFDSAGKVVANLQEGWARMTARYDERGREIERVWFAADGAPNPAPACARLRTQYDDRGNVEKTTCLNALGEAQRDPAGVATSVSLHNSRDQRTRVDCFDDMMRPVLSVIGYAAWSAEYDARGLVVASTHFGVEGFPIANPDGAATTRYVYDDMGRLVEEAYFDPAGRPLDRPETCARLIRSLDPRGLEVERSCLGPGGQPATWQTGWSRLVSAYDTGGRLSKGTYFGPDGKLTEAPGYASIEYRRSDGATRVGVIMRGVDGGIVGERIDDEGAVARVKETVGGLRATRPALFDGALGILATGLVPNAAGVTAGIQVGDILIRYGERPLNKMEDLLDGIAVVPAGTPTVELHFVRAYERRSVHVPVGRLGVQILNLD